MSLQHFELSVSPYYYQYLYTKLFDISLPNTNMNLSELQERVHQLNRHIGGEWDAEWQLLWVLEELGELSRELQKQRHLPAKLHQDGAETIENNIQEEFGDVLYGLISLAKNLNIDPLTCLSYSISKFEKRHNFNR